LAAYNVLAGGSQACTRSTGGRPRRRSSLQTQVREDLFDHRLFQDRGDDLQLAAAVRAVLQVEIEHPPELLGPAQAHWAVMRAPREALNKPLAVAADRSQ